MDIQVTDAKLREVFKQNAPPSNERHLAAALRPDRPEEPGRAPLRSPKATRRRWTLRTAAIMAAVLVLVAAAGIGAWKIVSHVGQDDWIIVINDPVISPTTGGTSTTAEAEGLLATVTDGVWELRVDRWGRLDNVRLPSDWLPETAYVQMEDPTTFQVVISEGGTRVSIEGDWGVHHHTVEGERSSADSDRIWYDFDISAGGRFVIWQTADGLQAEETIYGSGRPMLRSLRGSLVKTGATEINTGESSLFPVRVDGKWGFIDSAGTIQIEPQFAGVRRLEGEGGLVGFNEGLCAVQLVKDGPWGFVDTSGQVIIEPQFDLAQWFSQGLAVVRNAGHWYFIDETAAMVLGPFSGAIGFSGGLALIVDEEGGPTLIDRKGSKVPEVEGPDGLRLSIAGGYSEGLAVAYTIEGAGSAPAGLAGYVDESSALVIEPRFSVAGDFSEDLAPVGVGENDDVMEYGYIDKTGDWAIQPQFWLANPLSEGLAAVAVKAKDGVRWGYIDRTGAWKIQPRFDEAHDFSEGLAVVWLDNTCHYIDTTGAVVITVQGMGFDFAGGVARVGGGFDGSPSYIDRTGSVIWRGE